MLGHKIVQVLRPLYPETTCTIRGTRAESALASVDLFPAQSVLEGVDGEDFAALRSLLIGRRPDVVVNCLGVVKQRAAAKAYVPSIGINSLLPHLLAEWAAEWQGRVIYFSTDCVFSGRKGGYTEADAGDAEDLYGRSKYLGEVATTNALTLRTSFIGRELSHHQSLLEWFLSQRGRTVRGFRRVLWSGVTTLHLAELVRDIIAFHPQLSGLYNVSSGRISKYELLVLLRDGLGLDVQVEPDDAVAVDLTLDASRLRAAIGYECPSWDSLVRGLADDPTPYDDLAVLHGMG
jgi:dTDP-4-dehydrorhamnose reductase